MKERDRETERDREIRREKQRETEGDRDRESLNNDLKKKLNMNYFTNQVSL